MATSRKSQKDRLVTAFTSGYDFTTNQIASRLNVSESRARYLITYSPTGVSREGWHDVKVTLKNARGEVTARPGYFVGGP